GNQDLASSNRGSDRLAERVHSVALEQREQPIFDSSDHSGSLINQCGIDLDQIGAGADMLVRVFGGRHAAYTDDRNTSSDVPVNFADNRPRAQLQRLAAQAARVNGTDAA